MNSELFPSFSPTPSDFCFFWYGANVTPCSDKHGPRLTPVCPVHLWALSPRCHVHTVLLEWVLLALLLETLSSGLNVEQIWTLHLSLPKPGQGARALGDFLPGSHHTSSSDAGKLHLLFSASLGKLGSQLSLPLYYIYQPWQRESLDFDSYLESWLPEKLKGQSV